jgi:hypothetical protein
MGKLTGILVGSAILLVFSYYVLSGSFGPLINWFGPIFGYRLNLLLGLMWLEQGTPLQYASIFAVWAVVGVVVGFSSKRLRSVFGTVAVIWLAIGIIFAISIGAIVVNLRTLSLSALSGITAVPPGSNIYAVLHEPVIIRYFDYFSSLFTSGSLTGLLSSSGGTVLTSKSEKILENIILFLIAGPLEAYIIMVVFGVIALYLKKRYVGPKKEKNVKEEKKVEKALVLLVISLVIVSSSSLALGGSMSGSGNSLFAANTNISLEEASSVSSIISHSYPYSLGDIVSSILELAGGNEKVQSGSPMAMSGITNNPPASSNISLSNFSGGAGISVVTGNGNLYNVYGLLNYSSNPSGFPSFPAFSNSTFSITILQSNIYQLVESFASSQNASTSQPIGFTGIGSTTLNNYYGLVNLVPNFMFIVGYNGSLSATKGDAAEAASYISSNLGITNWGKIISLNTNSLSSLSSSTPPSGPGLSLYIYSGYTTFQSSATKFSNNLLNQISTDANENLLKHSIDSGYIVPGATPTSANSSLIVAGQINSGFISQYLNSTSLKNYSSLSKTGIFALDLSYWDGRFHSTGSHSIDGASLFNYNGPLNISQKGDVSVFGFGTDSSSSLNATSPFNGLNFSIFINNATLASAIKRSGNNSSNISVTAIPAGPFYLSQYSVTSNATFPANLTESVAAKYLNSNKVALTFTIWNNDTAPVTNLNISMKQFFTTYGGTVRISNNAPQTVYMLEIAPGQHSSFSYELLIYGTGNYYILPLQSSYSYDGKTFVTQIGSTYSISGQEPSVAYAVTSSVTSLMTLTPSLRSLASFHLGPLNIVELIILLLVVLDVYIEYNAFKKWRESKKLPVNQPEVKQ